MMVTAAQCEGSFQVTRTTPLDAALYAKHGPVNGTEFKYTHTQRVASGDEDDGQSQHFLVAVVISLQNVN